MALPLTLVPGENPLAQKGPAVTINKADGGEDGLRGCG